MDIEDISYSILINSDIDTIKSECFLNKTYYKICNNSYFWIEKFKNDKLHIITNGSNINEWIEEYNNVSLSIKETYLTMLKLINGKQYTVKLTSINDYSELSFLNVYQHQLYTPYDIIINYNKNLAMFNIEHRQVHSVNKYANKYVPGKIYTIILDENELYNLLFNIYYYINHNKKFIKIY